MQAPKTNHRHPLRSEMDGGGNWMVRITRNDLFLVAALAVGLRVEGSTVLLVAATAELAGVHIIHRHLGCALLHLEDCSVALVACQTFIGDMELV